MKQSKDSEKKGKRRGPKPVRLKLHGDWKKAIAQVLRKPPAKTEPEG
jgi:hypothetical protein